MNSRRHGSDVQHGDVQAPATEWLSPQQKTYFITHHWIVLFWWFVDRRRTRFNEADLIFQSSSNMLICVGWRHGWLFFIRSEIDSSAFGLELTKIFWICFHFNFSAYPVWGCVNGATRLSANEYTELVGLGRAANCIFQPVSSSAITGVWWLSHPRCRGPFLWEVFS